MSWEWTMKELEIRSRNLRMKMNILLQVCCVQKFNKGQYLQNELLMNTVMKNNKSGIRYNSFVQKKATNQYKAKQTHKSIKCFECGKNVILPITGKSNHQLECFGKGVGGLTLQLWTKRPFFHTQSI
jgi:hypothetical protein